MTNCKSVYPHRLIRPLGKYKGLNNNDQFKFFLDDILINEKKIKQYVADNQKRATAKRSLNHASCFPCEYCFSRGVSISENTDSEKILKKKTSMFKRNLFWKN